MLGKVLLLLFPEGRNPMLGKVLFAFWNGESSVSLDAFKSVVIVFVAATPPGTAAGIHLKVHETVRG